MPTNSVKWPLQAKGLAVALHEKLSINHQNWHKLKGNHERRAAELFSGALVQLLSEGDTADVEALITQGSLWLKKELQDPGCPHRSKN